MTTPQWVLLAFAMWTLFFLTGTVAVYRWTKFLTGKVPKEGFPGDVPHGDPWYRRAMRAHANCVENLPVYGALVLLLTVRGFDTPTLDALAIALIAGRVLQSLTHVLFEQTTIFVLTRFTFFAVQVGAMVWMGAILAFG